MNVNDYVNKLTVFLDNSKIKAKVNSCRKEFSFLIFDIELEPGGTFAKVEKRTTEIALCLKALSEPIIYPITRDGFIRMEVMMEPQETVLFKDIINEAYTCPDKLPLVLGKLCNGQTLISDLTKMPHLLIGGTTGSGKSVLLQSIINGLMLSSQDCQIALIDPKRVEFSYYDSMNQLFAPIAKDIDSSLNLLESLIYEMELRFKKLERSGSRNIFEYKRDMPYIVVVIDELADLMMSSKKDVQNLICRLAQKSRACGIHLIAATQRPSVDVVTGIIKANFPARISCQVSSSIDSRTILNMMGAERLIGSGDAIIFSPDHKYKRFKGAFIDDSSIKRNVNKQKVWWSGFINELYR
jgi:S-DNA-T family DNA segregation ATPase FtsK/SpoIIIE